MTFDEFYIHWYSRMIRFAREYVTSKDDAEDIVQDVFLSLYGKYNSLTYQYQVNLVAYIFTSIKNRCIDLLRKKIKEQESIHYIQEEYLLTIRMKLDSLEVIDNELFKDGGIEHMLEKALNTLPERCRIILIKHKIEGYKQKDIAQELNISIKTVENQLTIAYKKLRAELKNYSPLLILLIAV